MKLDSIQLTTTLSHNFTKQLGGETYKFHIRYNEYKNLYIMNIDKFIDDTFVNIINGLEMHTNVDIFLPFQNYNYNGTIIKLNLGSAMVMPTYVSEKVNEYDNTNVILDNIPDDDPYKYIYNQLNYRDMSYDNMDKFRLVWIHED